MTERPFMIENLRNKNIATIDSFFTNVFTSQAQAKGLLHDDFAFQFMGICSDCTKYNKQTYFDVWINQVIPTRIPNWVELSIVNKIADSEGVVYTVQGKAEGVNGSYNNNYAMVFTLKAGKIFSFHEYHSDLLWETRLYKKEVISIEEWIQSTY